MLATGKISAPVRLLSSPIRIEREVDPRDYESLESREALSDDANAKAASSTGREQTSASASSGNGDTLITKPAQGRDGLEVK
jgi:hypothetical protein